jgi:hypothetical protein
MNDDRPDNVTPTTPAPPVNEREVERLHNVRLIQQQTADAAIDRVRKFGPPQPQPMNQSQRLYGHHTAARNIKLGAGMPSNITTSINGGKS